MFQTTNQNGIILVTSGNISESYCIYSSRDDFGQVKFMEIIETWNLTRNLMDDYLWTIRSGKPWQSGQ